MLAACERWKCPRGDTTTLGQRFESNPKECPITVQTQSTRLSQRVCPIKTKVICKCDEKGQNNRRSCPSLIHITTHGFRSIKDNSKNISEVVRRVPGMDQAAAVSLWLLSLFIVFTNGTACGLILWIRQLRTPSNFLIMSLAFSDVLIGAVLVPIHITAVASPANGYLTALIMLSGVASLCGISFDRYTAVFQPFQHRSILKKHLPCMICAIWLLPIAISLVPLLWHTDDSTTAHRVYLVILCALFVVGPYMAVFIMYYRIFRKLKEHSLALKRMRMCSYVKRRAKRVSLESKVSNVFFLLVIMFLLSWFPVLYITLAFAAGRVDLIPPDLELVSLYTVCFISLVNPVLYSLGKEDLKKELQRLVLRRGDSQHSIRLVPQTTQRPTTMDTHVWHQFNQTTAAMPLDSGALRVVNFKFPLQPHQKYYITQYEEFGFSLLSQMKDDHTTNPHYLTYAFHFKTLGGCTFKFGSERVNTAPLPTLTRKSNTWSRINEPQPAISF